MTGMELCYILLRTLRPAAVRPASEPWPPPLVTERPRETVRRMIDAAAAQAAAQAEPPTG